jgi:hypothetical protein
MTGQPSHVVHRLPPPARGGYSLSASSVESGTIYKGQGSQEEGQSCVSIGLRPYCNG